MQIARAAVVGVGLIGGSLAAAWRESGFAQRIVGVEADPGAAKIALDSGLVDEIAATVPADAELVAVCTPSDQISDQVAALVTHAGVVFDVGSVKGPIVQALIERLGQLPPRFVPAHPVAGSEQSGPGAARADLFRQATTVLTPTADTDAAALELVRAAWRVTGSGVVEMAPEAHDEMLAVTSHLPHLLAFAFMQQVEPEHLPFTGGGFRDFTRIAGANPELWWRILSMNKSQVLAASASFTDNMQALTRALEDGDAAAGVAALTKAVALREQGES